MNLERVPNEEKLQLCRKYYLGGFALLPFLWLVNVTWFFKEAFFKPAYTEQPQIQSCEAGQGSILRSPGRQTLLT